MTAVLAAVALALVAALVVFVDVKPWRRPPVLTVTITADTAGFDAAMARVVDSFRPLFDAWAHTGETFAQAATRMEQLSRLLWLDEYRRIRDLPASPDPSPFPRVRPFRWLP